MWERGWAKRTRFRRLSRGSGDKIQSGQRDVVGDLPNDHLTSCFDPDGQGVVTKLRRGGAEIGAMRGDDEEGEGEPEGGTEDKHLLRHAVEGVPMLGTAA